MEFWTIYLLSLLTVLLLFQQWRLHRYRTHLTRREELFRIVTENAADMIALVDVKGNRLYNSPSYQKVLGYSSDELARTSSFEQIHPEDRLRVLEASRQARRTGIGQKIEYRIRHKDGRWRTLESTASVVRDSKGEVTKLVIVNRDISDRKHAEAQLEQNLFHDPLTGLANRQLFLDRLEHTFSRTRRDPAFHFAILLLDLDGFTALNSSLGAAAGDQVLTLAGRRIALSLRAQDTVARADHPDAQSLISRLGGDEFAILLEDTSDASDAMRVGRRIQDALAPPMDLGGSQVSVSASVGIAIHTCATEQSDHLLQDADVAMRRAKALGGHRCEVFDETMHSRAEGRLRLEAALRTALDQHQFRLLYQPIVQLGSRDLVGFEALLRWQHPHHGLVSPDEFLQVAEDSGLILGLSSWVFRQVCRRVRSWQSQNPVFVPLRVTVNASQRQFSHPEFVQDLRSALQESELTPAALQLEVSEITAIGDPQLANDVFAQLKRMGVRVSLGDVGIGFSSLSWLRRWPIDELKIDMALVRTLATDRQNREVVELILGLGRSLGVHVVAEGVETDLQADRLLKLGCEFAQGYLFSRPLEPERAEKLLTQRARSWQASAR